MKTPERRAGATVAPKGFDVLISVHGVPGDIAGEAEILLSATQARLLAHRLLEMADHQDRQRERLNDFKRRMGSRPR